MNSLLVDIYKTKQLHSGLGQFSLNFYEKLIEKIPLDFQLTLLHSNGHIPKPTPSVKLIKASFKERYLPFTSTKVSIWHSLHQFPSHQPPKGAHQILTIHDLNFLEEKNEQKADKYLKQLQKNIDRANSITAISNYTKSVAEKHLNLKDKYIHVIHNGVTLREYPKALKPDFVAAKPYFFSIGILSAKKNFHLLLPLIKRFENYQLIIAGKKDTAYGKQLEELIRKEGVTNQVNLCGQVTDEEKFWLYSNCEALWFPSAAEGFGLPVIEALSVGKPVFLSTLGSLPEIGGKHAHYWNKLDVESMETVVNHSLMELKNQQKEKSVLRIKHAQSFNWNKAMEGYLSLYEKIFDEIKS